MLDILCDSHDCEHCKFKSESASTLKKEELDLLKKSVVNVSIKKGEKIMVEGFPHTHVIYLKEGFAKLHKEGPTGKDQILKIATPSTYIGIPSLMSGRINEFSASAISHLNACYIDGHIFKELIQRNGDFASAILSHICKEEIEYFTNFVALQQKHNRGRLADALIYFSEELYKSKTFELPFSHMDVAALIGTTRESVNRILREFEKSGLITYKKRHISIDNMEMLQKISEFG